MNINTDYIDVAPTWETAATALAHVMTDGNAEGQKLARAELIRMGKLVDNLQAQIKTMKGAS